MIHNAELVENNECKSAEDIIYTYYDEAIGAMEAFGYSAFLVAKLIENVLCLWDEKKETPCVIIRKQQMEELLRTGKVDVRDSLNEVIKMSSLVLVPSEKAEYDKWGQLLRARKKRISGTLFAQDLNNDRVDDAPSAVATRIPLLGSHSKNETAVILLALILMLFVAMTIAFGGGILTYKNF